MGISHQQGGLKLRKNYYSHFVSGVFAFFGAFLVSALIAGSLTPAEDTSASTVTVSYRDTGYFVTVDSPDSVALSVDGNPTGQVVVSDASVINVTTNAPLGYKLYISASNNELTSSGISQVFSPVSTGANLGINTWGFSLDPTATTGNVWFPVPEITDPTDQSEQSTSGYLLSEENAPNIPDGTNISLYYGINADTTMPTGIYSTTVTYTAFAEGIPPEQTMQEFTLADCNNLANGGSINLLDSRDNNTYRVTKLADGNCWMTENLKLNGGRTLTSADSNVTSDVTLPANITEGTTSIDTAMQIASAVSGYDGNYYNWCAVTVSGNCSTISSVEQTSSVCPKGWQLPSNSGNPSYVNLFNMQGASNYTDIEAAPLFFTRAGNYASGFGNQSYGYYWTRVSISSTHAYSLFYGEVDFKPNTDTRKSISRSVRCVMDMSQTMQNFTIDDCRNLNAEETIKLTDARDGKEYNVAKLKDGNCWMQQNLALDGGRTLTSADSNVTSDVTLPANITPGTASNATSMQIVNNQSGYDGNLYNWCAATVSGDCSAITTEQTNSVCPKGWQLPSNTGSPSFSNLFGNYGLPTTNTTSASYADAVEASPLYFARTGGYSSGYWRQGNYGIYWSRTPSSSSGIYAFEYNAGNWFYPRVYNYDKKFGIPLRCVMADPDTRTLTNLTNMQDMTTKICANSAEHESKSLADSRDTNSYRVTKMKDGNCWMTQNLKLAGPKTLRPSDSNVSADVDIPAAASSGANVDTSMQIWNEYSGYDGKYYNWCAAVVYGVVDGGTGDCSSVAADTEQLNSICPKGFRLPNNSDYHSFTYLFGKYDLPTANVNSVDYTSAAGSSPLYLTRNGYYDNGYSMGGDYGQYWYRVVGSGHKYGRIISLNSVYWRVFNNTLKSVGINVRCLTN